MGSRRIASDAPDRHHALNILPSSRTSTSPSTRFRKMAASAPGNHCRRAFRSSPSSAGASRAGGAIVKALGLDDWVADDDDGYNAIARTNASMASHLEALRAELPARVAASAAGNGAIYTRRVEEAIASSGATIVWRSLNPPTGCRTDPASHSPHARASLVRPASSRLFVRGSTECRKGRCECAGNPAEIEI
jgi:hypothetical protein